MNSKNYINLLYFFISFSIIIFFVFDTKIVYKNRDNVIIEHSVLEKKIITNNNSYKKPFVKNSFYSSEDISTE